MGDDRSYEYDYDQEFNWLDQDDGTEKTANQILKEHITQLTQACNTSRIDGHEDSAASYKKQIYQIKCWIDEIYAILPTFEEENDWEKERVFDKLKGNDNGRKK